MRVLKVNNVIEYKGDACKILALGVEQDGKVFCHLASTTKFRTQANGKVPHQNTDWIDGTRIDSRFVDIAKPVLDLIEPDSSFTESVIAEISENGCMPKGRGKDILVSIMTKNYTNGSRKNSKAYKQAHPEVEELFEKIELQLSIASNEEVVSHA